MGETSKASLTQAQRREKTRSAVLDSACRLFGQRGYADTSLEDIAADSGVTIRPIYHYFGNKKALFAAVNEVMEQRIVDSMGVPGEEGIVDNWRAFLALCENPGFRRIVLVDSPNILGRERWSSSAVMEQARANLGDVPRSDAAGQFRAALLNRVVIGAFTEAALAVAEAPDPALARREAERLMGRLFANLRGQLSVPGVT